MSIYLDKRMKKYITKFEIRDFETIIYAQRI